LKKLCNTVMNCEYSTKKSFSLLLSSQVGKKDRREEIVGRGIFVGEVGDTKKKKLAGKRWLKIVGSFLGTHS
jgi:hypothetical protein